MFFLIKGMIFPIIAFTSNVIVLLIDTYIPIQFALRMNNKALYIHKLDIRWTFSS